MSDKRFQVVIAVLDRVTEPLRQIRTRIDALGRSTGIGAVGRAALAAARQVRALGAQLSSVAGPLGTLTAAGSVAGMASVLNSAVGTSRQLRELWDQIGVAGEKQRQTIAAFRFSLQQTGGTAEEAGGALVHLRDTMMAARTGGDDKAASLLRHLGIALRDRNGPRQALDVLPQIARAFERVQSPIGRAAMAATLFGNSSPALTRALAEIQRHTERFRELGLPVPKPEDVAALDDLGTAWSGLGAAVSGVTDSIGAALAPVLRPLVDGLAEWVSANRELIVSGVRDFVTDLSARLKSFDWNGLMEGLRGTQEMLKGFVKAIGGVKVLVMGTAIAMAGPFVASILAVGAAIAKLGLALVMNPIATAILVGIGLIAGAVYLIWRNWGGIVKFFKRLWSDIQDSFGQFHTWLKETLVAAFEWASAEVKNAWQGVAGFFEDIWTSITARFLGAWEKVRPLVDEMRRYLGPGTYPGQSPITDPSQQRRRSENERDRGGVYRAPDTDGRWRWTPGSAPGPQGSLARERPSLASYRPGDLFRGPSAAGGAGARSIDGRVAVVVRFENAPAGLRAEARSEGGSIAPPALEVGYAFGRSSFA